MSKKYSQRCASFRSNKLLILVADENKEHEQTKIRLELKRFLELNDSSDLSF